jgi:hypothetical protein
MYWKGVRERYPLHYTDLGMTTEKWMQLEPQEVVIADLYLTQSGVYFDGVLFGTSESGDPLPHVVCLDGELELHDGHHRVMRALLAGEKSILARVLVIE